jgi:hypothetical protein
MRYQVLAEVAWETFGRRPRRGQRPAPSSGVRGPRRAVFAPSGFLETSTAQKVAVAIEVKNEIEQFAFAPAPLDEICFMVAQDA